MRGQYAGQAPVAERGAGMSSQFAVDQYLDRIIPIRILHHKINMQRYEYFNTEEEAKDWLVDRAGSLVHEAEKALDRAEKRWRRCLKKYGVRTKLT